MTTTNPPNAPELSYVQMARVLANPVRWSVLAELLKHDVLPATDLAKKLGQGRSNLGKHLAILRKCGVVEQWHSKLYRIPQRFRVPGEKALDFGCAVLRLDRVT